MVIRAKEVAVDPWTSPLDDSAGRAEAAAAALRKITPRRQTKAELIEYRKQLEALVEMRTAELNATNRELRLRLEWLTAVNLVNQIVARSADYAEIFGKITEIINRLFMPDDSFITELDGRGRQLKILAHSSGDSSPALIGSLSSIPERIRLHPDLIQGELIFLSQEEISELNGPLGIHVQVSGPQSLVLVPLLVREQVLGFLGLEWEDRRRITSEETNLLKFFSTDIAQIMVNARLFEQTKALIAEKERSRLARDLHDSVTQVLFSANLVAEVLPQSWARDPKKGMQSLEKLQRLTRGALAEMRTMLLELRPSAVVKTPLDELMTQLTEAITSRSGLPFQLYIDKIPFLPEEVQLNFYHVAQEALNNIVKHSQANNVIVGLSKTALPSNADGLPGYEVRLLIQDDGVGFYSASSQSGGLGIGIMRERAAAIQAAFSLRSEPGYGTRVTLAWSHGLEMENL